MKQIAYILTVLTISSCSKDTETIYWNEPYDLNPTGTIRLCENRIDASLIFYSNQTLISAKYSYPEDAIVFLFESGNEFELVTDNPTSNTQMVNSIVKPNCLAVSRNTNKMVVGGSGRMGIYNYVDNKFSQSSELTMATSGLNYQDISITSDSTAIVFPNDDYYSSYVNFNSLSDTQGIVFSHRIKAHYQSANNQIYIKSTETSTHISKYDLYEGLIVEGSQINRSVNIGYEMWFDANQSRLIGSSGLVVSVKPDTPNDMLELGKMIHPDIAYTESIEFEHVSQSSSHGFICAIESGIDEYSGAKVIDHNIWVYDPDNYELTDTIEVPYSRDSFGTCLVTTPEYLFFDNQGDRLKVVCKMSPENSTEIVRWGVLTYSFVSDDWVE